MNRLFQTLMLAAVAVIAFVMIGALSARFIGFRYETLAYVAWVFPVGAGFLATKDNPLYLGLIAGAVTEFVRMTLGWVFASAAEVGPPIGEETVGAVLQTIALLTLLGAVWGLLGGGLRRLTRYVKQRKFIAN